MSINLDDTTNLKDNLEMAPEIEQLLEIIRSHNKKTRKPTFEEKMNTIAYFKDIIYKGELEITELETKLEDPNLSNNDRHKLKNQLSSAKNDLISNKEYLNALNREISKKKNKDFLKEKSNVKEIDESFSSVKELESLLENNNTTSSNIKENIADCRKLLNNSFNSITNPARHDIDYFNKLNKQIDNLIESIQNIIENLYQEKDLQYNRFIKEFNNILYNLPRLKREIDTAQKSLTANKKHNKSKSLKSAPSKNSKYNKKYRTRQERRAAKHKLALDY